MGCNSSKLNNLEDSVHYALDISLRKAKRRQLQELNEKQEKPIHPVFSKGPSHEDATWTDVSTKNGDQSVLSEADPVTANSD
mmetsp:Transcript_17184/g.47072  ORF Transcript_17184/g.47072 Transcript_17184/m.47072 type:complete len:82 (-) Transcript_17184:211-456(-)